MSHLFIPDYCYLSSHKLHQVKPNQIYPTTHPPSLLPTYLPTQPTIALTHRPDYLGETPQDDIIRWTSATYKEFWRTFRSPNLTAADVGLSLVSAYEFTNKNHGEEPFWKDIGKANSINVPPTLITDPN